MKLISKYSLLFPFLIILLTVMPIQAQADSFVLLCVEPENPPPASVLENGVTRSTYLMGFATTDLVGVIISENAAVTLYSHPDVQVAAGVYHVVPDAQTGGLRRNGKVAEAHTTTGIPSDRPCSVEYPDHLSDELNVSIPIRVSTDQAMIIQLGGDDQVDTAPLLGSLAFHNLSNSDSELANFQLIQTNERPIDVTFPYVSENPTRFAVIANKDVSLRRSFTGEEGDFGRSEQLDSTSFFIQELAIESPLKGLFSIMNEGQFHIYPATGRVVAYPAGGFLRLEISDIPARREPQFDPEANQRVMPLSFPDFKASVFLTEGERQDEPIGEIASTASPRAVRRVEDDGRLIVVDPTHGEVVIEAWMVEVINP